MRVLLSRTTTGFVLVVALCLALSPAVLYTNGDGPGGGGPPTFGQPTISGIQGVGFEQDIRLDPTNANRVYTSVPGALSSDTSWIWHSEDGGKTFKWVVAGIAKVGKPGVVSVPACAGGGDTELAVDTGGNLYFNDLTLANFSTYRSEDHGATFICSNTGVPDTAVDRQWYAVDGNPRTGDGLGTGAGHNIYLVNDEIGPGNISCPVSGFVNNTLAMYRSPTPAGGATAGILFGPAKKVTTVGSCDEGIMGNDEVSPVATTTGKLDPMTNTPATLSTPVKHVYVIHDDATFSKIAIGRCISNSVSSDQGAHWLTTCNAANAAGVDRPWIATFGDPQDPQEPGALYQTVDQIGQCITACGLGQVGSNMLEITWSHDGVNFFPLPVAQQIEPDGIVSGIVTDHHTGAVYIAHTGLVDQFGNLGGADANSNDNAILVVRFPNGYNSTTPIPLTSGLTLCQARTEICTTSVVYRAPLSPSNCDISSITSSCTSTVTVGQDFSPIAIDRAGNLYVVWSQALVDSTGKVSSSSQIYMVVSTDHGANWGPPVRVSAATPSLQTNVFPWIAAGDPGRVDIVWYGTPTLGSCPNQPCGSSALINAHWSVMMAQSLNAIVNGKPNASPSFTTTQVSEVSNHFGAICTMGIGCTTGGDRGLIDFLSVTVGLQGEANVVWADAVNRNFVGGTSSALIAFNRQVAGASLYANVGQVTGPAPASGAAVGSRDAFYSADGMTVPATGNLVIKSASVTMPDTQHYRFKIVVSDLRTLFVLPTLGGTDAVWLVRWEVPDPNGAGHLYFAAMESDGGMTPTFYDGETLSVNTTHGKFLTYNRAHSIQGSYTPTSPGVITLDVPVADVGGNADATLFSITALTATLVPTSKINSQIITASSTSTGPIFNQIDATAPFDFPPQAAPPPGCRQADGDGDEPGKNGGIAHFHFHHDDCNQQPESEDFSDPGSGTDFHSTQVTAVSYDGVAHTVTIAGLGTNNGLPVAFTIVAVDSTLVPPGVFSITLSDGYSNSGSLLTGSILLR